MGISVILGTGSNRYLTDTLKIYKFLLERLRKNKKHCDLCSKINQRLKSQSKSGLIESEFKPSQWWTLILAIIHTSQAKRKHTTPFHPYPSLVLTLICFINTKPQSKTLSKRTTIAFTPHLSLKPYILSSCTKTPALTLVFLLSPLESK